MKKIFLFLAIAMMTLSLVGCSKSQGNENKNGYVKDITGFEYSDARDFSEGLVAVKLDDKCGYIDKTGKEVIPFKYSDARDFSEGLVAVKLDDKWGYITYISEE